MTQPLFYQLCNVSYLNSGCEGDPTNQHHFAPILILLIRVNYLANFRIEKLLVVEGIYVYIFNKQLISEQITSHDENY